MCSSLYVNDMSMKLCKKQSFIQNFLKKWRVSIQFQRVKISPFLFYSFIKVAFIIFICPGHIYYTNNNKLFIFSCNQFLNFRELYTNCHRKFQKHGQYIVPAIRKWKYLLSCYSNGDPQRWSLMIFALRVGQSEKGYLFFPS